MSITFPSNKDGNFFGSKEIANTYTTIGNTKRMITCEVKLNDKQFIKK